MTTTAPGVLVPAVGDTYVLALEPISRSTLALFAGGSGDHNPMHVDLDVARSAGLDDVFAHGMLGMAYLARLLTDHFPQSALRTFTTRFTAITPVLAQPTCTAEVVDVDGSLVTLAVEVRLADGTTTLAGTATLSLEGIAA